MIRLCVVTPAHSSGQLGGAEYQIDCLLNELARTGRYEIYFLAAVVREGFRPENYQIIRIGQTNALPRFGLLTHARPLLRELGGIRPDVIYQRVGGGYTALAAYYARRHGARMIWHVAHDTDVAPQHLDFGRNPIRRTLEKSSIRYGIRHADHIVCQTADQARLLQSGYGRQSAAVIPNFHPLPEEPIDKQSPFTVVWVANLKPWKRPEVFIRLAASLRELTDARFVMVGALPAGKSMQAWRDSLLKSIEDVPNLSYLGERSQQEVNALLARAHVLVNTSTQEGFPNTFIQAWMRETAVVSLSVDPDGLLQARQLGVHAGTEARLSEAVRALATDHCRLKTLTDRAKAHSLEHHSLRNASRLEQLIRTGRLTEDGDEPQLLEP